MSRPRNNLDELQRKHAPPSSSPSAVQTPQSHGNKAKFKPAKSQPASTPATVTARKLPSFSTPGFIKVKPAPLNFRSTADNSPQYVEVSSNESTPLNKSTSSVPSKRLSASGPLDGLPLASPPKRSKTDHVPEQEKENISLADKGKGRAREQHTYPPQTSAPTAPLPRAAPTSSHNSHHPLTLREAFNSFLHDVDLHQKSESELKAASETAQELMETCDKLIGVARSDVGESKDLEFLTLLSDLLDRRQTTARSLIRARQRGEKPPAFSTPGADRFASSEGTHYALSSDDQSNDSYRITSPPSAVSGPSTTRVDASMVIDVTDPDKDLWDSFVDDPIDLTDITDDDIRLVATPATPPATQPHSPITRVPSPPLVLEPVAEPVSLTRKPFFTKVKDTLTQVFQKESFRPKQLEAICAAMEGRDVFVLFPTGSGKSLTFQIPAVVQDGVTIVISPLVSLMRDQVDALVEYGVDVAMLIGDMPEDERNQVRQRVQSKKKPKLLYITPEQLQMSEWMKTTLEWLENNNQLARFVVDEAHCITDWGRRFRGSYTQLTEIRKRFPTVPISALTATANPQVEADIISRLGMRNCAHLKLSFNRKNLDYDVRVKTSVRECIKEIAEFIKREHLRNTGIIYCLSRKSCEDLAKSLRDDFGLRAKHFHADMDPRDKERVQREWSRGDILIIVATVAFGMGIDKADVRYVVHFNLPATLANYYQETGRAGRDGKLAVCILYYNWGEASSRIEMIRKEDKPPDEIRWMEDDLWHVFRYCRNNVRCRRQQVLDYFGEKFDSTLCNGLCNNCRDSTPVTSEDHTENAVTAVRLLEGIGKGADVTKGMLSKALKGSKDKTLLQKGAYNWHMYGACKDLSMDILDRLVDEMVFAGILTTKQSQRGEYTQTYMALGHKVPLLKKGKMKVVIEFRETASKASARQRKPRGKAASGSINTEPLAIVADPSAAAGPSRNRQRKATPVAAVSKAAMLSLYRDDDDDVDPDFDDIEVSSPPLVPKRRMGTRAMPSASQSLAQDLDSDIEEVDNPIPHHKITFVEEKDLVGYKDPEDAMTKCKVELEELREKIRRGNQDLADIMNREVIEMLAIVLPNDPPALAGVFDDVDVDVALFGEWRRPILDICSKYHMQRR